jgi:hypothetical protein
MRAANVGTNQITGYVEKRLAEKAAKSTINRELALLRRAFSIGFDAEPQNVTRVPKFHKHITSEKGNERRDFVDEQQYRKLADEAGGQLWLADSWRSPIPTASAKQNCLRCAALKWIC